MSHLHALCQEYILLLHYPNLLLSHDVSFSAYWLPHFEAAQVQMLSLWTSPGPAPHQLGLGWLPITWHYDMMLLWNLRAQDRSTLTFKGVG